MFQNYQPRIAIANKFICYFYLLLKSNDFCSFNLSISISANYRTVKQDTKAKEEEAEVDERNNYGNEHSLCQLYFSLDKSKQSFDSNTQSSLECLFIFC